MSSTAVARACRARIGHLLQDGRQVGTKSWLDRSLIVLLKLLQNGLSAGQQLETVGKRSSAIRSGNCLACSASVASR
jgi:hypothetical protein